MVCSICGYAMSAFDETCPRCNKREREGSSSSKQQPPSHRKVLNNSWSQQDDTSGYQSTWSDREPMRNNNVAWIISGVLGVCLVATLLRGWQGSTIPAPIPAIVPVAPAPVQQLAQPIRTGPPFHEVDAKMDGRLTGWTEAQRQAYWETISGSQVTWKGEVVEVEITSGGQLTLKCNPKTWTSDVSVSLDGTQIDLLPSLNKGRYITVRGILQDHTTFGE